MTFRMFQWTFNIKPEYTEYVLILDDEPVGVLFNGEILYKTTPISYIADNPFWKEVSLDSI